MTLKEIKKWPFEEFSEESRIRWKVTVREPVVDGERLLVVDAIVNDGYTGWRSGEDLSFRIICAKKSGWVKGINKNGNDSRNVLVYQSYFLRSANVMISEKDESRLHRFLGNLTTTENHELDRLHTWIEKVRLKTEYQAKKDRGELMDDDYQLCPDSLPEGLVEFVRNEIIPADNTLVYQKGNVRGRCFVCGEKVTANLHQKFLQHCRTYCPSCGADVVCVLNSSNAYRVESLGNVMIMQKGTDGQTVFFRQFRIERDMTVQWNDIKKYLRETVRYAIRGQKVAKWQHEGKSNFFSHTERYELSQWERWQDTKIYDGGYFFCPAGAVEAVSGTLMQYADLQGYLQSEIRYKNPMIFLQYHAKYPVFEFLWKAGYRKLMQEKINGTFQTHKNVIRWQRKVLKDCFKFPMHFLKAKSPQDWTLEDINRVNFLYEKMGERASLKDIQTVLESDVGMESYGAALPYTTPAKALRYIERQFAQKNGYWEGYRKQDVAQEYRDYIEECEKLHLDLTDKEVLFPKNLRTAHERTMVQVAFEQNKEKMEAFSKVVKKLQKFSWEKDGLCIRPAAHWVELKLEGKVLHHCVGGYADRMAEGKTAIFLIRRTDAPEEPFYTLELKDKKIIQCRGDHNRSYLMEEDVKAFVEQWMEKIVNKKGKKKEAAA